MKKNKDKLYKDLKVYNMVMSNIWKLITFILAGIFAGYLLDKYAKYHDINYMLISLLFFITIGTVDFFISIIRECKRLEEEERKQQELKKQIENDKIENNEVEDNKVLENIVENNENESNSDFK